MSDVSRTFPNSPPEQRAIWGKCYHPSGRFVEFKNEEIEQSIPERFELQVRKYPERIAVKSNKHVLTYDELNRAANRLARTILQTYGATEKPIALLLTNGVPMVIAMIGVLKAGQFYVVIDPSHPTTRLKHILKDSQAGLILTDTRNFPLANELNDAMLPFIDMDELDFGLSTENPGLPIPPDALCCIRYTSGSTGGPKGIFHNHRNLLHHTMNNTNSFHTCLDDRIYARTDDFKNPLLNGAALYLFGVKDEGLNALADWLAANEITICRFVPTVFRHFLDTLSGKETFPHLRLIELQGESILKRDVERYRTFFSPECILANKVGAREIGGSIRCYFLDARTEVRGPAVPAGYAVEDKDIALLEDDGRETIGSQTGEIAVRSRYLALGYWGRPELTAAKFLPSPDSPDERIYLTGDLGRISPDGCLEWVGRKDLQVKVRGNKVEPAEIEITLLDLRTIKEAAVVAWEDQAGGHRLAAYLVPAERPPPSVHELRNFLKDKLPDYMIPSAFVVLDALPLMPNGKIDRRLLPAPGRARPELQVLFLPPRTPLEESLGEIWAELLGVDQVGIADNFLDLGGHSLMATQMISRVIAKFGVELPIKALLEASTVSEMAVVITQNQARKADENDLAKILSELEALSDEETQRRLSTKR